MCNLTRQIAAAALLLSIVGMQSAARSQTKTSKKERTGSVSGRVTIKGEGAPGVVVSLRPSESGYQSGPSFRDATDQDGNYRITGVLAGSYRIAPLTPSFVLPDVDVFSPTGKSLFITEGEAVEGIDFALVRGGVITGKVTDAEGRPIIEQGVDVIYADQNNTGGFWRAPLRMGFQTDDRGIYRIFGIPPGRYRVAAGQSEDRSFERAGAGGAAYKQTFHPNVTDATKATIIELAEGAEAKNVDITLGRAIQGFAASGRTVDGGSGRPVANVRLSLSHIVVQGNNRSTHSSEIQRSNSQGEFRVENLAPGRYLVSISQAPESDMRADPVTFDVHDQEVTGLLIKTSNGASLAGIVVLEESQNERVAANLARLYVGAHVPGEGNNEGFGRSAYIKPDGGFLLGGFPAGIVQFSVGAYDGRNTREHAILRVERDGLVQTGGLQIQDGEHVTGVRIVIAAVGNATIRGLIKVENGTLPSGARLNVELTKGGERPPNTRPDVDSRGHFVIERLAAGSYELTALVFVRELGRMFRSTRQLVSVAEGAATEVTLIIDLKENPESVPRP